MEKLKAPLKHSNLIKFRGLCFCLILLSCLETGNLFCTTKTPKINLNQLPIKQPSKDTSPSQLDNDKIHFSSGKISSFLKKNIIKAEGNVRFKYKNIILETDLAYLYFDKNNTLFKITTSNSSTLKKEDLMIEAQETIYHLEQQTIEILGQSKITQKSSTLIGSNVKYDFKTDELKGKDISGSL